MDVCRFNLQYWKLKEPFELSKKEFEDTLRWPLGDHIFGKMLIMLPFFENVMSSFHLTSLIVDVDLGVQPAQYEYQLISAVDLSTAL